MFLRFLVFHGRSLFPFLKYSFFVVVMSLSFTFLWHLGCSSATRSTVAEILLWFQVVVAVLVRKTYGAYKNLYISFFLRTISGPTYYGPP